MYIFILILPLLGSILAGLCGRYFGREGSALLSTFCLFFSWLLGLFIFYEVGICHSIVDVKLYQWFILDIYSINIGLLFDALSSTMIVVVTSISMLVHLYSTGYMSHDPHLSRFMSYLSLFTFFMLILVTSNISFNYLLVGKVLDYVLIY